MINFPRFGNMTYLGFVSPSLKAMSRKLSSICEAECLNTGFIPTLLCAGFSVNLKKKTTFYINMNIVTPSLDPARP